MNVSMLDMNMKVEYHGNLYEMKKKKGLKTLDLSHLGIIHITEIKGLVELTDLQVLILAKNRITEIKSLENLTSLEKLYLNNNQITEIKGLAELTDLQVLKLTGNQITEIKGLENLTNLENLYLDNNQIIEINGLENLNKLSYLTLWKNPVFKSTKGKFGRTGGNEQYNDPLALVEYCQLAPKRIEIERIETERIETERIEAERIEAKRRETERIEAERIEVERIEAKKREAERRERERKEKEEEEKRIKNKAIQYIKKLPMVYKEINFEKISSKIGLEIKYLGNLVEDMIINKEIDAEINGDTLIFKKAIPESKKEEKKLALKEVEIGKDTEFKQLLEIKENLIIFISYATKDVELFKVKEIAEILTRYKEIEDVLYWQEDMKDNIIKYMSENVDKCDVMLLFCSPNALKSKPIEKEWTTADIMNKPIIPIFVKPDHIPPLLKTRLGIEFDTFDQQKMIEEIYNLILKKL